MALKDIPEHFVSSLESKGVITDVRKAQIHRSNLGFFAAIENVNIDNRLSSEQESIEELRKASQTPNLGLKLSR